MKVSVARTSRPSSSPYVLHHYIDGKWVDGGSVVHEGRNPAHLSQVVSTGPTGTETEVASAIAAAQTAFQTFRKMPAPYRGELIHNLGVLVRNNKIFLAKLMTQEMGKPLRESLGSVQEVIDTCMFFASEGRRLYGQTVPSEMDDKRLFTYRRPIGVCGIITAGNFPMAVPSWYLVPALLCGNTVVWKPSEVAPAVAHHFAQLIEKSGFPPGVCNMVLGNQHTGAAIVTACQNGLIQKIGFTGGTAVGKQIGTITGGVLQRACLELGGKNPMVIMPDAHFPTAIDAALFSAFGTAGQRCTSLGILMVHADIKDRFLHAFMEKVHQMRIGDPMDETTYYGPMMAQRFLNNYNRFCEEWIAPNHRVISISRGRITQSNPWPALNHADLADGLYAHPVVVDNVSPSDTLFREETFGPMIGVMSFTSLEEAIELANASGYGLSAAIFTQSPKTAFAFQEDVRAGMISINNSTSGAEAHLPFGGTGRSGNGARQSGIWVLDEFTYWQSVNWDYSATLQRAQMDVAETPGDPGFTFS